MHTTRLRFLFLVVSVCLIGSIAPVQAQGTFAHGAVVALQGTPHLWFADEQGVLHWGGDTRALSGKHIAWSNRVEVSLDQLRTLPVGDPWLSAGLLKDGDPIYLVKWETEWELPQLLHIQSIGDVELFGINGSNYGNFVIDRPAWEARHGISAAGLQRGVLASAVPAPVPGTTRQNPIPIGTAMDFPGDGWRIAVISTTPNATNQVLAKNRFNDPPRPGHQFFIARLQVTRLGSTPEAFLGAGDISVVGSLNRAYQDFDRDAWCGVIPDELDEFREIFSGGNITGNLCWQVPSSEVSSLVLFYDPDSARFDNKLAARRFFSLR